MIVTATRGKSFAEPFNFKNEEGEPVNVPTGHYTVSLTRGDYARIFENLRTIRTAVVWSLTADDVATLPYSSLYFTLNFNGEEITRGILRVVN